MLSASKDDESFRCNNFESAEFLEKFQRLAEYHIAMDLLINRSRYWIGLRWSDLIVRCHSVLELISGKICQKSFVIWEW
jgi:hypothetical protein